MNDLHVHASPAAGVSAAERHLANPGARRGPFVPVLLMGLAVLGWTVFQTIELVKDHHALEVAKLAQQAQVQQALHLRGSLSALAGDTQKAADAGDAGAALIVAQLRKRGITIHPDAPAPISP